MWIIIGEFIYISIVVLVCVAETVLYRYIIVTFRKSRVRFQSVCCRQGRRRLFGKNLAFG